MLKMNNLNPLLEKFFSDTSYCNEVISNMKAMRTFNKRNLHDDGGLLYFLWYAKLMDGTLFRHHLSYDAISNLAHVIFLIEKNEVYLIESDNTVRLVYRAKKVDDIHDELRIYLYDRHRFMLRGDRYNCNTYLSESLPALFDDEYYTYVSVKIHAQSKPSGGGDGIRIDTDKSEVEEIEVKYTASGGARQTFSPKQLDKKFYVLSISRKDLDKATNLLNNKTDGMLPIDFYICRDKFVNALESEVIAKDARSGSGRYEMSNMISKIESNRLYERKHTLNIDI